ncbi:peptidoglycan N-acetylglucosamine deacetylase A [bacterium 1xD42-67]|nr:peptidoglycan N-acetylglucosamine deacetylase A [bacterium 1xD42-67]
MDRKRSAALICAAVLAAALPGPAGTRPAGGPAEVELEGRPLVALTFDDGPREATTGPLLDGLALREVPATFFLVGSRIGGNEDLVRRMAAEGHQIGVHTFDHVALKGLSRRDFDLQVGKTRAVLADLLGEGEFWLRPPYGLIDQAAAGWAGGPLILWSVDPEDWKDHDVDRIVAAVVEHVSDGDIILMHDIFASSEEAALRVVDALLAKGYCFVTVEQLMEQRGAAPEAGARCRAFPPAKDRGGNF